MKFFRNLKHIFVVTMIALMMIFGLMRIFSDTFTNSLNGFFLYRTSGGVWQDKIYQHSLTPTSLPATGGTMPTTQIKIIKIDDDSLNYLQSEGIVFGKNIYTEIVQKLKAA